MKRMIREFAVLLARGSSYLSGEETEASLAAARSDFEAALTLVPQSWKTT